MRRRKWALLAVLLGMMVVVSGCFGGGRTATGGVSGRVLAPKDDLADGSKAQLVVKDLITEPSEDEEYVALPEARVTVKGTSCTARTNEYGEFVLTRIPTGPQFITVWHELYKPISIPVTIVPDKIISIPGGGVELKGKGYYLLIGVGAGYDYEAWKLYGIRPEKPMAAPAVDLQFMEGVIRYDNHLKRGADIAVLKNGDATLSAVRFELEDLISQMEENDYLVIYFSGHGMSADTLGFDAIALADGLLTDGELRDLIIEDLFRKYDLQRNDVTLILDTCFSESFANETPTYFKSLTSKAFKRTGYTVIASSREDEESYLVDPNDPEEPSLFTNYVIEGLGRGLADKNMDGIITVQELCSYVEPKVRADSRGKQNVFLWPANSTNVISTYTH